MVVYCPMTKTTNCTTDHHLLRPERRGTSCNVCLQHRYGPQSYAAAIAMHVSFEQLFAFGIVDFHLHHVTTL